MKLGERLVETLGDERSDILSRWMALHIAELMTQADSATGAERAMAQDRCRAAILELWAHRRELPDGRRPLEAMESVASTLAMLDPAAPQPFYGRRILLSVEDEAEGEGEGKQEQVAEWLDVARVIDRAARVMVQHALMEAAAASKDQDLEWVALAKKAAISDAPDVVLRILLARIDHPFGESKPDPDAPIRSLLEHLGRLQHTATRVEGELTKALTSADR